MKTITSANIAEATTGSSLLFFFRQKGCSNCDKTKPVIESIDKAGLNVFGFDADAERPLIDKYGPKSQNWNLPLLVYMENGKVINTLTGLHSEEEILEMTKTIQNISDVELQSIYFDLEVKRANIRKESFDVDVSLAGIAEEMKRREDARAYVEPAVSQDKPASPSLEQVAKEAIAAARPSPQNTHLVTKKKDIDLSGFPVDEEAPCDGCQ